MTLPPEIAAKLREIRGNQPALELYAYVAALHRTGWSYTDIALPLGVTRSAISNWDKAYNQLPPAERPPLPLTAPKPKDPAGETRRIKPDVPPAERDHIRRTAEKARQNTRWSNDDSPERQAANELLQLIKHHIQERGVPVSRFADIAGVNRRAIMQRIEREAHRVTELHVQVRDDPVL